MKTEDDGKLEFLEEHSKKNDGHMTIWVMRFIGN